MILAFDPGYTTGFAAATNVSGKDYDLALAYEIPFYQRIATIEAIFADYSSYIDAIVLERFALSRSAELQRAQTGSEFPSVRVIETVHVFAHLYGLTDKIVFQTPADRKSAKVLEAHRGLVGLSDHVQDAYRHLRYYILTHRSN